MFALLFGEDKGTQKKVQQARPRRTAAAAPEKKNEKKRRPKSNQPAVEQPPLIQVLERTVMPFDYTPDVVIPGLCKNKVIQIQGLKLQCQKPIHIGRFGSLWEVLDMNTNKTLVLKECITDMRKFKPEAAAHEIRIQLALSQFDLNMAKAHGFLHLPSQEPENHRFLLAMDQIPGDNMDMWLYNIDPEMYKSMPVDMTVQQINALGGHAGKLTMAESYNMALKLLRDIAPLLDTMSQAVFHREICPSNLMVNEENGTYKFSLLDFGSTVPSGQWVNGGWREMRFDGNLRYWPACSWMVFLEHSQLSNMASVCNQMIYRLDLFSMALTTTELLLMSTTSENVNEAFENLRLSFISFWQYSLYIQQFLQNTMNPQWVKFRLMQWQVHHEYETRLATLRSAMRDLGEAMEPLQPLLLCLADMLSESGNMDWMSVAHYADDTIIPLTDADLAPFLTPANVQGYGVEPSSPAPSVSPSPEE